MVYDTVDRRTLLRLGGVGAIASLAGCNTGQSGQTTTETTTATTTESGGGGGGNGGAPPGADQLGGPNALRAAATVEATILSSDQGAGRYVNTPAVVWLEKGGTVTWNVANGSHSVTTYHPDYGRPLRVPEAASPFDSGVLASGKTFEHTFETTGVYNYFCRPHEGLGMVGLVVVGGPQGGPGTTAPDDVGSSAAAKRLERLREIEEKASPFTAGMNSTNAIQPKSTIRPASYHDTSQSRKVSIGRHGVASR